MSFQEKFEVLSQLEEELKKLTAAKIGAIWLDNPRSVQLISGSIISKEVSNVFLAQATLVLKVPL